MLTKTLICTYVCSNQHRDRLKNTFLRNERQIYLKSLKILVTVTELLYIVSHNPKNNSSLGIGTGEGVHNFNLKENACIYEGTVLSE